LVLFTLMNTGFAQTEAPTGKHSNVIPQENNADRVKGDPYVSARSAKTNVPNTDLPPNISCPELRVIFVLDESGSIGSTYGPSVRTGALSLANSLLGSGAQLHVVEFSTSA